MSFTNFNDIAKNAQQVVTIIHVATGATVEFPAFIKNFEDNYQLSWGNEQIFGRNDPIKPYQSTTRQINIGFTVLSPDLASAKKNLFDFSKLTKMIYPVYSEPLDGEGGSIGRVIKAPPLLRLSFVNFIQSADGMGQLLGCLEGLEFSPDMDPGVFVDERNNIFPKQFDISFRFTPQHETPLGWGPEMLEDGFLAESFPYGSRSSSFSELGNTSNENGALETAANDRALSN